MIRSLGKTLYACAYTWSRASQWTNGGSRHLPFIVGYHRVVEDFDRAAREAIPSMLVSTAMFERHLDWIASRYRIVSLDEIGLHLESEKPFRQPTAAITFDDGYADVYQYAYPILLRKGIPATMFVVSDLIDTDRTQVYDILYVLLRRLYKRDGSPEPAISATLDSMGVPRSRFSDLGSSIETPLTLLTYLLSTFAQAEIQQVVSALQRVFPVEPHVLQEMEPLSRSMIQEMHRKGFTIGSHTSSHVLLTQESPARIRAEVTEPKRALEKLLNAEVRHFAYPDGRFNPFVVNAVNEAGYRYGYGICSERDPNHPLLTIPRKVLWEKACLDAFGRFSPAVMNCQANGAFNGFRGCPHNHRANHSCQERRTAA